MKIKSLLIGMLACTALVGCSDDDIIQGGNEQQEVQFAEAYVTLSIESTSNSSRGVNDEGTTNGDTHGDASHSGHENDGTTAENDIKDVLVVLSSDGDGVVSLLNGAKFKTEDGLKKCSETWQVSNIGDYRALVVINPVDALLQEVGILAPGSTTREYKDYQTEEDVTGLTPSTVYNGILDFNYVASEADNTTAMTNYYKNGFMMANREECIIPVTVNNNHEENPATGVVEVERAISKITFRSKDAVQEGTPANTYEVKIQSQTFEDVEVDGWYVSSKNTDGDKTIDVWSYTTFTSTDNNTYFVRLKADKEGVNLGQVLKKDYSTYFEQNVEGGYVYQVGGDHEGYKPNETHLTKDTYYKALNGNESPERVVLDQGTVSDVKEEIYYVQLQQYALFNLSKSMYGVRHLANSGYTTTNKLGRLGENSMVYLVDPNTTEKNKTTFAADGSWTLPTGLTNGAADWFYNVFATVANEANTIGTENEPATLNYFKSLSSLTEDTPQNVTQNSADLVSGSTSNHETNGNPEIGAFLSYCFENSVKQYNQHIGLTTGIIFVGQIYTDAACTKAVDVMYKYNKKYYRELSALIDENPALNLADNATDEQAEAAGVEVYKGGKCFYYSNKIKHFDDGNNDITEDINDEGGKTTSFTPGVMEFAIMRNNIYSLSIGTISEIGSATVLPTPGTVVADQGAYITMQAKILPWIVRFNNINF